jgi:beta-glucanase (GH16 family)
MHNAIHRCRRAAALAVVGLSASVIIIVPSALAAGKSGSAARSAKHHAGKDKKHHARRLAKRRIAPLPPSPVVTAPSPAPLTPSPAGMPGTWKLALDSEFTGTALDTSIWQAGWFGSGTTSPVNSLEQDCYSSNNVVFPGDGSVHLKVTNTPSTCGGVTRPYTGALLSSNPNDGRAGGGFQYTYGALEARVYIPAAGTQVANWPAVWTDGQPPWPANGENDIMEGLSGQTCFHFHSPSGGPGACVAGSYSGWHTFASDWEPGSVTYYYDGVKVGQITTGITSSPMYIVLDNAVSQTSPALAAPADMRVADVRVWQH